LISDAFSTNCPFGQLLSAEPVNRPPRRLSMPVVTGMVAWHAPLSAGTLYHIAAYFSYIAGKVMRVACLTDSSEQLVSS